MSHTDATLAADKEHLPGVPAGALARACEGCVGVLEKQKRQLHSVTFQVVKDEAGRLAIVGRAIDSCGRGWSSEVVIDEAAAEKPVPKKKARKGE